MAMTINLTLVVQIAHFFIAYWLISRFLLTPGYEALKVDHERLRQLRAALIDQQGKLAQKQEYKRSRWKLCQSYFYQRRPAFEEKIFGLKSLQSLEPPSRLPDKELTEIANEVSKTLKKKVLNG